MKKLIDIIGKISLLLTLCFCVLFLFSQFLSEKKEIFTGGDNHIAFILDVSQSMNVSDIDGKTRLLAAKEKIFEIIVQNPGYDFALSIFAGESQRVLPFTGDLDLFITFLRGVDSNNLTLQGTDVSLALDDAMESFGEDSTGNIILLTDGDEQEISISSQTKQSLEQLETTLSIIGVGTKQGGYLPNKIYNGQRVHVGLNEEGLKELAKELDGRYYGLSEEFFLSGAHVDSISSSVALYILIALLSWTVYLGTIFYGLYYAKK